MAMDDGVAASEAVFEAVGFLSYFKDLPDSRQCGKVIYPLDEVLLLCLLAVLAGAETFTDIARFGDKKLDLLRRFRPFANGTPSHDHLGDIFATLDAEQFQRCFVAWVASRTGASPDVIAIDGKTVRRSFEKMKGKAAIHMVSAFAARQRLVLGQVKVADKSNEIVAIPKLLDMLAIEGAIVTIDAMGCQRAIAQQIVDQGGDYVLALKGNQGTLHEDVRLFLDDPKTPVQTAPTTVEGDHGRIESRTATVSTDIAWLKEQHAWPGLTAVGKIARTREIKGVVASETVYYLLSAPMAAPRFADTAREHWGVENSLHWVLDVTMDEDQARNRCDNGPENLGILRHLALNLLSKEPSKISKRRKLNKAAWNNDYLLKLIAQI